MSAMDRREALRRLAGGPLAAGVLASCASGGTVARRPVPTRPGLDALEPPREFRGAWVASVDNIDWPSKPGLSAETQRAEIDRVLDTARRLELNALFLQVRPTCDALYRSEIEPWSAFLSGRQGDGPRPDYDPLDHWVRGAHARGLDLHAWVNPFRARHPKSIGPDTATHVSKLFPRLVRSYNGYLWLDPGSAQAREITLRVIDDLLTRYELDGVHMDDYFYPYPKAGVPFPDSAIHETYRRNGGTLPLDDWRRENINRFVREVQSLVRLRRPGALFTISPFGIWRPDNPPGVKGFDAFAGLHADSRRWLGEGWCDALMPQLYWPVASAGQPFRPLLDWWVAQNPARRHVWPGLYLTKIPGPGDADPASGWQPAEILDQVRIVQETPGATGFALFSVVGLLQNRRTVADLLASGPLAAPALVPESPWLGAPTPGAPDVVATREGVDIALGLDPSGPVPTRRYVVRTDGGSAWRGWVLPAGDGAVRTRLTPLVAPRAGSTLSVTPIGPNGATGPAARVTLA